jgi:hypothetical protein
MASWTIVSRPLANWKVYPDLSEEKTIEYTPFLKSRKFFAVDDSGSTAGSVLRQERAFVDRFREGYTNSNDTISLWGNNCDTPTTSFENVNWHSGHGGTSPSHILRCQPALETIRSSDVWFLLTDGEIWGEEVQNLANLALQHDLLNIPLVFVITGSRKPSPATTDISVGISFFASSQDTLILFKETSTGKIYVIAGKGRFASFGGSAAAQDLERWDDLQCFNDEAAFFANCEKHELHIAKAEDRVASAKGISLGPEWEERQQGPVRVDLNLLSKAGLLSDEDLFDLLAEEAFDTLAVAYKIRGRVAELRAMIQKQKIEQMMPKLEDVAGAGAVIAKMGDVKITDKERQKLQEQLRVAHAKNRENYQTSVANFANSEQEKNLRKRNQLVDAALRALASVEAASYSADILSRKSNRARRAEVVESVSTIEIGKLDLDAPACKGFCLVCCGEDVVMSICFKEPEPDKAEDNTTDFALNFPLAAGAASKNVDLISSQNVCFQCAVLAPEGRSIYREPLTAVIPALQYNGSNKKYINDQLYLALTARLATGAAGISQLFMAILQELLSTKSWAGADLAAAQSGSNEHNEIVQRRKTFQWMLEELVQNTWTREDFKETGVWVKYPQALSWAAKDFEDNGLASFAVTYPAAGFNNLLILGERTGAFNEEQLRLLKSAKVIHSIAAKYLAELQVALQNKGPDENRKQKYLEVIYQSFNGPLVPKDQGSASLVTDIDTFTQRLQVCIPGFPTLVESVMPKIQLILFWLLFKQKGHCTAQTFFTRLRETEPLATTVLNPRLSLPTPSCHATLLSIFISQDATPINPSESTRHITTTIPFANPFGASVLHCGVPSCNTVFTNITDPSGFTDKDAHMLRTTRARHFIQVFGITSRFEKSNTGLPDRADFEHAVPPSSFHTNLHIIIVREWASNSLEQRKLITTSREKEDEFVRNVEKRLCKEGRGNVYQDNMEREIRALLPSFWKVLQRAVDVADKGHGIETYEHDFEKNGVQWKAEWEWSVGKERLGEWEFA